MQIYGISSYNKPKTTFEGFNIPYDVENHIIKRTTKKNRKQVIQEISTLMTEFDNRKVMLDLMLDPTGKHLEGSVYDGRSYCEHFKESWLSEMFASPLKFINKLVKKGRKVEDLNEKKQQIHEAGISNQKTGEVL